jgi:DHA1 family bicyclomycin/chloramphenicol resistance-like MFS transporter
MTAPSSARRQKYLGEKGLIALITFLSAFVPLSTDLYLPALPGMALYFNVSADLANLTLILFFVFFAAGTLLWGPLSDKYGRKPVLLIGLSIYTAASLACAGSVDIYKLIAFRILQAIGGSGAFAVATAMIKDVYDSKSREPILAMVQSMVLISPVAAPVLGALLLKFMSWRGVFWTLAFIGLLALAGSTALQETIDERNSGSMVRALGGALQSCKESGLLVSARPVFFAERICDGVHSCVILHLHKRFWAQPAGLQLLFRHKCHRNDLWPDDLYAHLQEIQT